MCIICKEWASSKVKIGPTLKKVAKKLKNAKTEQEKQHLWELSDRILEDDSPTKQINESIDSLWWDATHKKDPEEL